MIWQKQGTSLNRLLCFSDIMFTNSCQLQSSLHLRPCSHRRDVNSTEFLVLFYTIFPNDFGEAKPNCHKNACISLLKYSTWRKQGAFPNRHLCFSDVMFTCQGKLGEFMPASKLASTFVLALIKEKSTPLNFLYFSTQLSLNNLAKKSKTAKRMLAFHC